MKYHVCSAEKTLAILGSDINLGLNDEKYKKNKEKYGVNVITSKGKEGLFSKILKALKEPMLLILVFSFSIAFGANLGKYFTTGDGDFFEVFGIFFAIVLSVSITLIMEGSSEKAFATLNKIYDSVIVKVIRSGSVIMMKQSSVVVGDIIVLESGDKIIADGRIVESFDFSVDESALTGESVPSKKNHQLKLAENVALAERKNMVYSGTYVASGSAKMVVTAIGDNTEIGKLAGEISKENEVQTPLQQKLSKLGKTITIIGIICAVIVFGFSLAKLIISGEVSFTSVQNLFITCIILIVAAVPEGLPTIVAISLALNMIKLSKQNALIKKMIATETTGAVSIICSDKTGTLTQNKMSVIDMCSSGGCVNKFTDNKFIIDNIVYNSTAFVNKKGKNYQYNGNATECALLVYALENIPKLNYKKQRDSKEIINRTPFSSSIKYMATTVNIDGANIEFIKGAGEVVLPKCELSDYQRNKLVLDMQNFQKQSKRVLCFAHREIDSEKLIFDGFCVLADKIREDVYQAIKECFNAGIKVKMLTGDNEITAFSIGLQLGICKTENQVINANEIDKLTDEELKKILPKITIVARSTPLIKLRIVKALKELGEVVAVTGDGINDAPAIRHADVGISMGISGSEITKEASDIVLLDDSFSTIVKAISFGRNVYKNLQRFILFQLSINVSALFIIVVCALLGLNAPFNTLQLLWINVIMDGPPALTLGLEVNSSRLMENKPVKRESSIVSKKMLIRIFFNGLFVGIITFMQFAFNILGVSEKEIGASTFTLFIAFQMFNAFNCRELGSESILKGVGKNKIMLITFSLTFILQIIIVSFGYKLFGISSLAFSSWIKILLTALSIIVISECYKFLYKKLKNKGIKVSGFKLFQKKDKKILVDK